MMGREVVLGVDTSNYTTSVALVRTDGELVANVKRLLPVEAGQCGLRQSDALFSHVKSLPSLMQEIRECLCDARVSAIGVSTRPRNIEGSYMPVFLAGVAVAESLAAVLNAPLYRYSHQCGHIMAALYSSGRMDIADKEFAAVHASGGTTEILRVKGSGDGFFAELVGGTLDLNAGQVIDRVGVMLGMPFPSGRYLEEEALKFDGKLRSRPKISGAPMRINLSGLQNMAERLYKDGAGKPEIGTFVFDYVGRALSKMIGEYNDTYGEGPVVCAGGVMCNSIIKKMLSEKYDVYFAEPMLSSDNAVGIATLALRAYNRK